MSVDRLSETVTCGAETGNGIYPESLVGSSGLGPFGTVCKAVATERLAIFMGPAGKLVVSAGKFVMLVGPAT